MELTGHRERHPGRTQEMETTRFITLPGEAFQLEEVNLPMRLARELAAQSVMVEVLPEEPAFTRRVEVHGANDDFSGWVDREGICWNDYHPLRVFFTDESRKVWRLPRRWAEVRRAPDEQQIDSCYTVVREAVFSEGIHLPSVWDLLELNLPLSEAQLAAGRPTTVAVHVAPHEPVSFCGPTQWERSGASRTTGGDDGFSCRLMTCWLRRASPTRWRRGMPGSR